MMLEEASLGVGFKVSKPHVKASVPPFAFASGCSSELLLQGLPACCRALCHGDDGLSLWPWKPPVKRFLLQQLPLSRCLFTVREQ